MKTVGALLLSFSCSAFSGVMGAASVQSHSNYLGLGGGYFGGNDQALYYHYTSSALTIQQSYNDTYQSGYGQISLGRQDHIDRLVFDHQIVVSKLGNTQKFTTSDSNWTWYQNVDFGYDWMPKINFSDAFNANGILGVHYARFTYQKKPYTQVSSTTAFDVYDDQIGFNLGAGLNYQINEQFAVGIKYQHWQYSQITASGTNTAQTSVDVEKYTPTYNMFGAEVRYYF